MKLSCLSLCSALLGWARPQEGHSSKPRCEQGSSRGPCPPVNFRFATLTLTQATETTLGLWCSPASPKHGSSYSSWWPLPSCSGSDPEPVVPLCLLSHIPILSCWQTPLDLSSKHTHSCLSGHLGPGSRLLSPGLLLNLRSDPLASMTDLVKMQIRSCHSVLLSTQCLPACRGTHGLQGLTCQPHHSLSNRISHLASLRWPRPSHLGLLGTSWTHQELLHSPARLVLPLPCHPHYLHPPCSQVSSIHLFCHQTLGTAPVHSKLLINAC